MTGLPIDGSSRGVGQTSSDHGIMIDSATNVAIANNEILGWNGVAVEVRDTAGVMKSPGDLRMGHGSNRERPA